MRVIDGWYITLHCLKAQLVFGQFGCVSYLDGFGPRGGLWLIQGGIYLEYLAVFILDCWDGVYWL